MSFKMGSNWAIFIEQEIIKWTYGIPDTNQEFLDTTVRFLSSLQQIGRELYEQGVASIQFERPVNKEIATNEIFIINLSDQFFFVISDISITARLLAKETIPYDIQQILCAVLVGQGAILYSYLKEGESTLDYSTDETYRSVLTSINVPYDLDSLVSDGRCSLSPLKLEELLLFHYLLRNKLETKFTAKDRTKKMPSWALMVDRDGLDVPLAYLTPRDPLILGNFLGAIYSYVQALFGVKPSALVFGGHDLVFLRFFGGKKYFLAASTDHIFDDKEFIGLLFAVPDSKRLDLAPSVKEFLIEKCSDLFYEGLRTQLSKAQDFDAAWSVFSLLNEEPKRPFVAAVEITAIKKIGKKAKKVLNAAGIFTLKELSQIEVEDTSKLHEALVSSDLSVEKLEELRDEARKILENSGGWKLLFGTKNE